MGAQAYGLITRYVSNFEDGECVLEIGSERGEGSTAFLADFCRASNIPFFSVDLSEESHRKAKSIPGVQAFCMKGEEFLEEVFPRLQLKIRFAYLDNFDWIWKGFEGRDWIQSQVASYRQSGLEMNNANSQAAHLRQTELLLPYAARKPVVLFDDTWQTPSGEFDGKGGAAVAYLVGRQFTLLEVSPVGTERMDGFAILGRL